jgi:hypothetical protein
LGHVERMPNERVAKTIYNNMHGAKGKIVNAKQARLHNNFKNSKCKLL